jgi:hypothetical protein
MDAGGMMNSRMGEVLTRIGAVFLPWLLFDGPLRKRLWRFRWGYLLFAVGTAALFTATPYVLPVFHLALLVKLLGAAAGMSMGGFGTLEPLRLGGFLVGGVAVGGVWLYTAQPDLSDRLTGQFLVPFVAVEETSDGAEVERDAALGFDPSPRGLTAKSDLVTLDKTLSTVVIGETGAGKTEAIRTLTSQLVLPPESPLMVFDYKGEYGDFVADTLDREVVSLSPNGADHHWNLFREAETEEDFDEIARALFPAGGDGEAGRQVFAALLIAMARDGRESGDVPTNSDLGWFLETSDRHEVYDYISEHEDLRGDANLLDPDSDLHAAGVWSSVQTVVNDAFRGDFAEDGDFSIREYMQNPDGRALVLDFPVGRDESVAPVYRFFVDWSIRYALRDERPATYLLDEFWAIPDLQGLERLVNAGRRYNAHAVFGLQSVTQLTEAYGEDYGESLLAGMPNQVAFRCADTKTAPHVQKRMGKERTKKTGTSVNAGATGGGVSRSTTEVDRFSLTTAELTSFEDGEVVIVRPNDWVHGQLRRYNEVADHFARARGDAAYDDDWDPASLDRSQGYFDTTPGGD